jgi:glycosyltransferase involved in cell wall biosynthesis
MEIVQVAGLYPPHLGGEELVVQRLAGIQAATHRVTVYTSDIGVGAAAGRQRCGRLQVVRDRGWPVGNTPVVPSLLVRLLRHRPTPHVVHVHTGLALTPEIVRVAAVLRRVPYVAHIHLLVRPSSRAGRALLPAYQRLLFGSFLRHAARVICLTGAMRDAVVVAFGVPPERVAVVPNGVDAGLFRPAETVRRAARELLFVGRLTAQKNVRLVVEAMAALPRDVTLRLVGEGELQADLDRRIAALGLTNVRLEGRLAPADVVAAYQRATAVLLPSSHEGLPLVLLEAMAAGAPVICSALPELVEIGGDAVLAVRPVTPASLAAAARALLDDPARRERLSQAARRRAAGYDWPAVAAAVEAVYQQVRSEWA